MDLGQEIDSRCRKHVDFLPMYGVGSTSYVSTYCSKVHRRNKCTKGPTIYGVLQPRHRCSFVPIYSVRFHEFSMTSMLRDTGLNVHCQARVALLLGLFTYGASAEYIEVYLTIAGNWCTSDQARSRAATDRSICNEQTLRRSHTVGDMIYLIPRFFASRVFVSNLSDG